jgi:hypothetical protein
MGGSDSEAASVWMAVVQVRGEERRGEAAVLCRLNCLILQWFNNLIGLILHVYHIMFLTSQQRSILEAPCIV